MRWLRLLLASGNPAESLREMNRSLRELRRAAGWCEECGQPLDRLSRNCLVCGGKAPAEQLPKGTRHAR